MLTFMCHGVGTWAKARHDFNTTEAFNEYREAFINNATSKYNAVCHPPTLCASQTVSPSPLCPLDASLMTLSPSLEMGSILI